MTAHRTLSDIRTDFARSRFLAMPIAGMLVWTAAGICGALLSGDEAAIAVFVCLGLVFPLGLLVARLTGEDLLGKRSRNELDQLFGLTVLMANMSWGIAIPFWFIDPSSVPLSAGILAGSMWIPFSWMIRHWVGLFHAIARTLLVTLTWFAFPEQRFVVIPAVIVLVYLITIAILARRPRAAPVSSVADSDAVRLYARA